MKLSIITVNLNNRDGLKRTIDSVVSQTFTDYEWIVIDGGSTDGSRELIQQYSNHFAYWCSEPDKGIYNAMNKGIAHAKGEYLQFLNSGDCLFNKKTLEKLFSKSINCDILFGDVTYLNNGHQEKYPHPVEINFFYLFFQNINHQACFYRKQTIEKYKYDETYKIFADWDLNLKLALDNKKFCHERQHIVTYDNQGISSKITESLKKEISDIRSKYDYVLHSIDYTNDITMFTSLFQYNNIKKRSFFQLIFNISNICFFSAYKCISFFEKVKKHN